MEAAEEYIAPDGVENHVDAASPVGLFGGVGEVDLGDVDCRVDAQFTQPVHLGRCSGGADDGGAGGLGALNRAGPEPAGGGVDQDGLSRLELADGVKLAGLGSACFAGTAANSA